MEGPFDLAICCFNTLQHLLTDADLLQAFRAARESIAATGVYAFDIYQPNPAWLAAEQQDRLARSITDPHGRHLEIREDMAYDAGTRVVDLNWRLVDRDTPGQPPLASTSYRLRQHFAEDVLRLLAEAGLSVLARYGDFDRSELRAPIPGSRSWSVRGPDVRRSSAPRRAAGRPRYPRPAGTAPATSPPRCGGRLRARAAARAPRPARARPAAGARTRRKPAR